MQVSCTVCNSPFEHVYHATTSHVINVGEVSSVQEAMNSLLPPRLPSSVDCPCGNNCPCQETLRKEQLPPYLVVSLNRVAWQDEIGPVKRSHPVALSSSSSICCLLEPLKFYKFLSSTKLTTGKLHCKRAEAKVATLSFLKHPQCLYPNDVLGSAADYS